jgi:glycosyltransferase involved in cell wall biosynthesis
MNILLLTSSFPRYEGDYFGTWILDYAREYARQGQRVTVIAPRSEGFKSEYLSSEGVKVISFDYFFPRSLQKLVKPPGILPQLTSYPCLIFQVPIMLVAFFIATRRIVRTEKYDVIHSQWAIPAGFVGALISKLYQIPHFITTQGAELYLTKYHPFKLFVRWVLRNAQMIFPVSSQMSDRVRDFGVDMNKVVVLPNAVDTHKFRPNIKSAFRQEQGIPEGATVLLTIRRLVKEKKVDEVISSFAKLANGNAQIYLVIIGDGPELKKLQHLAKGYGLVDKVRFLGFIGNDALPPIYSHSDIYVLSSDQEGLSLSLLEAMSSGMIVVSNQSVGSEDVIKDGVNGFLYNSQKVCLTETLQFIMSEEFIFKRESVQLSAIKKVKRYFSVNGLVKKQLLYFKEGIQ